jgi:hypothetical protein
MLDWFKCLDLFVYFQRPTPHSSFPTFPQILPTVPSRLAPSSPPLSQYLAATEPVPRRHRRHRTPASNPAPPSSTDVGTGPGTAKVHAGVGGHRRRQCAAQQQAGATGGRAGVSVPGCRHHPSPTPPLSPAALNPPISSSISSTAPGRGAAPIFCTPRGEGTAPSSSPRAPPPGLPRSTAPIFCTSIGEELSS